MLHIGTESGRQLSLQNCTRLCGHNRTSHPVYSSASDGFSAFTVSTVKTVYVITAHSRIFRNSIALPLVSRACTTIQNWLPSMHVAATVVKTQLIARGARYRPPLDEESERCANRSESRGDVEDEVAQSSETANNGRPSNCEAIDTIPVAMTSANDAGCIVASTLGVVSGC